MLFFIPGTPKDIITYVVPFTKMKLLDFIAISSVARIPSIISSTLAGATLESGNLNQLIIAVNGEVLSDEIISKNSHNSMNKPASRAMFLILKTGRIRGISIAN